MAVTKEIPGKRARDLRICSFNVNGVSTLFNYHPWSGLKTLDAAFQYLNSDIITLQELKLSQITSKDLCQDYHTFITIPRAKKGYSGVGVYVRKAEEGTDTDALLAKMLRVRKVEEGITGVLPLPSNKKYCYRDAPVETYGEELIGGYPETVPGLDIDQEGRCIMVELSFNVVIIAVYCPANSMGTDEMESFRMQFLRSLIERCRNLVKMGKQVILLGDINVSRDLIDSDEYIKEGIKLQCIRRVVEFQDDTDQDQMGREFEKLNRDEAAKFRILTVPKQLINSVVYDEYCKDVLQIDDMHCKPIFVDTLRQSQNRRLKMYTCWNTLKNYRSINSGSRIDHIFATPSLAKSCHADIWNHLMGSDHCPVFCDFDLHEYMAAFEPVDPVPMRKLKFEAATFYGVNNGGNGIDKFFGRNSVLKRTLEQPSSESASPPPSVAPSASPSAPTAAAPKAAYTSRKKPKVDPNQLSIKNFFFNPNTSPQIDSNSQSPVSREPSSSTPVSVDSFREILKSGKIGAPHCAHGEPATLRTSQKPATKGKKFWCCSRTATSETFNAKEEPEEDRCNYFKWVTK